MNKYLIMLILLVGCTPSHKQKTDFSLPQELKDCKVFYISDGWQGVTVVRCPKFETTSTKYTVPCGKSRCTRNTAVINE